MVQVLTWEVRVLTLAAGGVKRLWDEWLPLEVRELPRDLAALDELLSDPRLLVPDRRLLGAGGARARPAVARD